MEAHCIDVESIGEVVDLPEDHPRRRHASECPRCRSLVESYLEFVQAEPVAGSGVEGARAVLAARIREGAERLIPSQARTSSISKEPWWRGFLRPAPAFAVVALVAVAAMVWTSRQPQESVLRDDAVDAQPFSLQPSRVAGDAIHLSWTPMAGADGYQVRIYGPDLSEVYRHPETSETSAVVARSALPDGLPPTLDLTWRVYALSGGDVIETSAPGSIRTP